MVFTIQSQYVDSVGKLRIIYGFHNKYKQLINLITFPLAPLNKVPIEPCNKVQSFSINNEIIGFIEDLKSELKCDETLFTSTGCWLKNSTFPPSVFVPIDTDYDTIDPVSFPLMIDGVSPFRSKLDTYKDRVHKANIFKQYVVFLYSCEPARYNLFDSFVIKPDHDYDFENWDPPNWLSLQNKKMIVASGLPFLDRRQRLSELSNQTFQSLNAERLETCIKDGGGRCRSIHLPNPSESNKWIEYRSPAGGHCLFHSVLRGWAKLHKNSSKLLIDDLEFNINAVDFDVEETNEINQGFLNHWTEIANLRQLTDVYDGPGWTDAFDRSQRVKENIPDHTHFWGRDADIQTLAKKLNICILVFSKPSLEDLLPSSDVYNMMAEEEQQIVNKEAKAVVDSNTGWHIFSPVEEAEPHFADKNNCSPERAIFINNSSGNHYNLLVPHIQVHEEKQEEPTIQLIVPNREFADRLDFYLQNQLQLNPELERDQKKRETIPDFYKFKSDFTKWDNVNIFSSLEGVKQWIRFKKPSAEYLKHLVSPLFRPSKTDLARLSYKDDPVFQKDLLVPFFFSHYQINNGRVALVQNVLSTEKTFVGNLFQALLVSRIWVLYQVNRGHILAHSTCPLPGHDVGFPTALPDLKWGLSIEDLERQINLEPPPTIFNDYNVAVYSPNGDLINAVDGTPQAHLIQYGTGDGYAAILFVSVTC